MALVVHLTYYITTLHLVRLLKVNLSHHLYGKRSRQHWNMSFKLFRGTCEDEDESYMRGSGAINKKVTAFQKAKGHLLLAALDACLPPELA